jgi:septal ring factor EnvC (AmiA/AmiB activator)
MNAGHLENQRIKLSRQIAKDMQKLAKLEASCQSIRRDIERAERARIQLERKLKTA